MVLRYARRFSYAFAGILYALKHDASYRQQFYGVALGIFIFMYVHQGVTQSEFMFLILAYTLILITELQNSALEEALDHVHPELHDKIGRSKDMAAGAVLIAGFFLVFTMLTIVLW